MTIRSKHKYWQVYWTYHFTFDGDHSAVHYHTVYLVQIVHYVPFFFLCNLTAKIIHSYKLYILEDLCQLSKEIHSIELHRIDKSIII